MIRHTEKSLRKVLFDLSAASMPAGIKQFSDHELDLVAGGVTEGGCVERPIKFPDIIKFPDTTNFPGTIKFP